MSYFRPQLLPKASRFLQDKSQTPNARMSVCKSTSLFVGHYELCRNDIGDLPGSPEHL